MGAIDPAAETEAGKEEKRAEVDKEEKKPKDVEVPERKDGAPRGEKEVVVVAVDPTVQTHTDTAMASRLQTQRGMPPIHVVMQHGTGAPAMPVPVPVPVGSTPPQVPLSTLNSRNYTNKISLFLFLLHFAAAALGVCFFVYKAIEGAVEPHTHRSEKHKRLLQYWVPPIEAAVLLGIILAFSWQKAVRTWPEFMVYFILWASFGITMAAGVLLLCFSLPATAGLGVALILFSIGSGLYACWVTRRIAFTGKVFCQSMQPVSKFKGLNGPAYLMVGLGFFWMLLWCLAVIGALDFYYPPLTIIYLVLSLAWTAEVMRNVTNLTVSRVIALYYLRGMQCNTQFSFQRAISLNLGSACLGSLFLPSIEALRILARGLNLLEGEDEFMFSCAHCCLHVMESIFNYGNSWAFVHIAAYGKSFVAASISTWRQFQQQEMEELVDSDITSSVCFLTGVSSGALCVILSASMTFATYKHYTATVSLIAFFVGYLMTRIGMALPQACIACYYVCYAENPGSRLFDSTIPHRLERIRTGREPVAPTPRFPHRITRT
ncbi:Plasma-membrane choline transporter family protein [Rhynchospora pubera]|uniref:Choline transporter-like protein n=1 Tax=Rhynchospora pubera TaxID=906938 RepID=A0AAV8D8S2_9POAL|nr:Plasma-membrane choline transporter family protein [Rhynchospora pubera]